MSSQFKITKHKKKQVIGSNKEKNQTKPTRLDP